MNTIAALAAGIAAGLICGILIAWLQSRGKTEALEAQLNESIPKIKVVQAINRNKMNAKGMSQKRKDGSNTYWNGALEAVWFDLKEDLQ